MLKKDLYVNAYILTVILIGGAVAYYVFFMQKNTISLFREDPGVIQVASRQSELGQQMVKAAVGMGYATNEQQFNTFKSELERIHPKWQKGHQALIDGDSDLGMPMPAQTNEYLELLKDLRFHHFELNSNASSLLGLNFTEDQTDDGFTSMKSSIDAMVATMENYQIASNDITRFFVEQAQSRSTDMPLFEYIGYGVLLGILLLQGFFIFRPLVKRASENHLSANKAFEGMKEAEQQLKDDLRKQKIINKKLYLSRKDLEEKNKKLSASEEKLMRSSEEQIRVNEKLISAQDELNAAYRKLQESEVEIRELADKQLHDNEKMFLAERKLQATLEEEKKSKEGLKEAMESLKNAQSQLVHSEKMASLGQLTAGIAHEINNPINFISSGMVSLKMSIDSLREIAEEYSKLEVGEDPKVIIKNVKELKEEHEYDEILEELDDLIKDVNYGVARTVEIVKGLRVFSRLDEEESKNANINENIDATLTLLRNKTKDRITITKHYDETMQDIECFPGQLNQVFMNILNNAIQAIPRDRKDGEITIYTEETNKEIMVRIKDNGVGIPDDVKDKIWEPFFTTKEVGVGTGLGMSITYGIVEKHNGKIELTSEVGTGTEFVITLPRQIRNVGKTQKKEVAQSNS